MCSNYETVTDFDRLVQQFGVRRDPDREPPFEFNSEIYPLKLAPFIRLDENGRRRVEAGQFGLLPHFAKEVIYGRKTHNARSETVHQKPSFRDAWKRSQRCIVPAEKVYEYCYETGKPVRWAIEPVGAAPLGIAGLWGVHPTLTHGDGSPVRSFTMLTVNADGHSIFQRMHAPGEEKRMPIFLHAADYDTWLTCSPEEAMQFFVQWSGEMRGYPAPKAPRKKKATAEDAQDPDGGDAPLL